MEAGWIGGCLRVTQIVSGMSELEKRERGTKKRRNKGKPKTVKPQMNTGEVQRWNGETTGGLENSGLQTETEFLSNLLKPTIYAWEYCIC